jgi:hypothetical protein
MAGVPAEIRTWHLPNTSPKCSVSADLFSRKLRYAKGNGEPVWKVQRIKRLPVEKCNTRLGEEAMFGVWKQAMGSAVRLTTGPTDLHFGGTE